MCTYLRVITVKKIDQDYASPIEFHQLGRIRELSLATPERPSLVSLYAC
jgi:hypothetical protein